MAEFILTDEEERQLEEGEAAGLLLDNPMFILAVDRIRTECAENILTSDPQDPRSREDNYNLSRGLTAITAKLRDMESVALSIVENAKLQTTTEEDEVQADEPDFDPSY